MKQVPPPSLISPAQRQEDWPHLAQLVAAGGQVIFGNLPPHVMGALATSLSGACASVLLRQGESLPQLLARLDVAVGMSGSGADERVFNEANLVLGKGRPSGTRKARR